MFKLRHLVYEIKRESAQRDQFKAAGDIQMYSQMKRRVRGKYVQLYLYALVFSILFMFLVSLFSCRTAANLAPTECPHPHNQYDKHTGKPLCAHKFYNQ